MKCCHGNASPGRRYRRQAAYGAGDSQSVLQLYIASLRSPSITSRPWDPENQSSPPSLRPVRTSSHAISIFSMDPITALGLAGTIATFVDLSIKVLSRAREGYVSAEGACEQTLSAEADARRVSEVLCVLRGQETLTTWRNIDHGLLKLCADCDAVADELLKLLQPLVCQGRKSRRSSLKKAILSVRCQPHVDKLMARLRDLQGQLQMYEKEATPPPPRPRFPPTTYAFSLPALTAISSCYQPPSREPGTSCGKAAQI